MDYIDIIGTIYDNSTEHTAVIAQQVKDLRLNKNQQRINEDIYNKIDEVDSKQKKSKGYFTSLEELNNLLPNPEVGDWAVVLSNGSQLICYCTEEGVWTLTDEEYKEELDLMEYLKKSELKTINNQSLIGPGNIELDISGATNANSEHDGLMSKGSYSFLQTLKNVTIPGLEQKIENLETVFQGNDEDIQDIIDRYNVIKEFINELGSDEDVLSSILNSISSLEERIERLENNPENLGGGIKHVFITESRYNSLEQYDKDVLYLIVNAFTGDTSVFGDQFPLILGGELEPSGFGDTLPFILE